ncbi:integrase [Rhodopseudomonas sp. BR0C11]|nr:integrase [Rhodopseudomonas sp. BR0C11]
MTRYLTRRHGVWHFVRRVPAEFAGLDPRGVIKESTMIAIADDRNGAKASIVAEQKNKVLELFWRDLIEGKAEEAQTRYAAARRRARSMGLAYMPADELAQQPLAEILERLDRVVAEKATGPSERDRSTRTAILGGEGHPVILLSELFERFERQVSAELTDMSPDQLRKWRNPKIRAVKNLISVVGDKAVTNLTHTDGLDYSEWWQDRVKDEGLDPDTANKDMGHINRMLFVINKRLRLGIPKIFEGMRLEGGIEKTRPPFDPDYVQRKLLAPDALRGLNDEARRVLFLVAGAGLRTSEAVNLNESTIVLGAEIPHVQVRPDGRRMKTPQSLRDIPLVGVALAAMREQPRGFPRYHDSAGELSATVNKFLKENNLRQGGDRTLYSLRHTFKDQLVAVGAQDSMIDALMGHKETGSKYGAGPSLKLKLDWLQRIAFTPPPSV